MTSSITVSLPDAFKRALKSYQAGHFDQAEALCRAILRAKTNRFDVLRLLALVQCRLGRLQDAMMSYDAALAIKPEHAELLCDRGVTLEHLKRHEEALASYEQALAIKPHYPEALNNRGNALRDLKRFEEALASYEEALAIKPDYVDPLLNRGAVLHYLKRFDEALASYDQALLIKPDDADALCSRGNALRQLKRFEEALTSYDRALAVRPDHADALINRGATLMELVRYNDALSAYDQALSSRPDLAEAWFCRGNACTALARSRDALAAYDSALRLSPDFAEAWAGRANALLEQGKADQAIICSRRALARATAGTRRALIHTSYIFARNFDLTATTAEQQAERRQWDEQYARPFAANVRPHANDSRPERRLRVGYVSSHFRQQAATYAFGGVLLCHDSELFEVVCYSDTQQEDDVTARFRAAHPANWRQTAELSDDALADLIRADGIDILVDLVGHMRGHRLLVFARRPAPVQVTGWGEPTGTGLNAMDYLLADPVLVPASSRPLLVEQVVDLPNFLGYWAPDPLPAPGALPALRRGYVTFGSFNRRAKIQDVVLRTWASVLRALPEARLVLKDPQFADVDEGGRIRVVLAEEGIEARRVTLLGPTDRASHFAAYQQIDIALDPFPHGGGMTTLDALWMGVPVVTWSGQAISSRLAAASLSALDLTDFITPRLETYADLAVAKARAIEELSALRASLRKRLGDSAFGHPARYTRAVEAAYRQMWRRWCETNAGRSCS